MNKQTHNMMRVFFLFGVRMFGLNRHKWKAANVHKPWSKQLRSPSVIGSTMRETHCSGQAANECGTGRSPQFPSKGWRRVLRCNCLQGRCTKAQYPRNTSTWYFFLRTGNYSFLTWRSLQVTVTFIKITTGRFANCSPLSVGYPWWFLLSL